MGQGPASMYNDVLKQVLLLEERKQSMSVDILTAQNNQKRLNLIQKFLACDLKKHRLFEYAAVIALANKNETIIDHLNKLYPPETSLGLSDRIKKEVNCSLSSLKIVKKSIIGPEYLSFSDRRLRQEITKHVLAQAKLYYQLKGKK